MRRRRTRLWVALVGVVVAVAVVLLVLVGTGILVLFPAAHPTVTVTGAEWEIQQGLSKLGRGWFGPSPVYQNGTNGFPVTVASGGKFPGVLVLSDLDVRNHTINATVAQLPFSVACTSPGLPAMVVSGQDNWVLDVTFTAPTVTSSETLYLVVTVDALTPGTPAPHC
ncbi:MAG TPA: hypothetical protein VEH57_03050 [Thermoplasmata archaeon]|nr:hypothetical protein [Thermoplasmata archaeon]